MAEWNKRTNAGHTGDQKGFTLIELLVTLSVAALLGLAAMPDLSGYLANSKLREGANTLQATAALARNEALKRNGSVSLNVSGSTLTIVRESDSSTLRTVELPTGFQVPAAKATFNSAGQLTPFGTVLALSASLTNTPCSSDVRCPALLIEAGGAASVCARGAAQGACL